MLRNKFMETSIRKTEEFEKALDIAKSLPEYFNDNGLADIEKELPSQIVYGAYAGKRMLGCASYQKINEHTLELAWLFVLDEFHGQGISTQLVVESLSLEGMGFSVCQVKTLAETSKDEGFARTRSFYEKIGFIPIQIIDPYPGWDSGNPCQIMVKFLR